MIVKTVVAPGKQSKLVRCLADLQLRVFIFHLMLFFSQNGFEPDILKYTSRQVLLVGTVESRAFLHPKATVRDAIDVCYNYDTNSFGCIFSCKNSYLT